MNRRSFLLAKKSDTPHRRVTSAGLEPYAGAWGRAEAAHLARRAMFGATKSDITTLAGKTMVQAVDSLLTAAAKPADPIAYIKSSAVAQGDSWVSAAYDANVEGQRLAMLQAWWIGEMLFQTVEKKPSITEKMILFWHNHFATQANSVKDARYMFTQLDLFREYALGNFKDLVRQVTLDPAMLRFLNGATNTKSHPNENYGRELQELFTIGKGAEVATGDYTNYTEADIKQAARVLTGWSDVQANISAKFTSGNHDGGDKTFSARYGNTVIKGGTTEAAARRELDELMNMIFSQDATTKYLVRKIYRWFVDYIIDDETEKNVITPLAQIFKSNNFEIKPVLDTLLKSAHFYDATKRGCMIKNPADFMLGTFRVFITPMLFPGETEYQGRYFGWRTVRRTMATLQMDLLNPPNVAGWNAYWQTPAFHELWINSDTLQKRVLFTNQLAMDGGYQLDENYGKTYIDVIELAKQTSNPGDINVIINEWCELAYPLPMPDEAKAQFKQVVLNGLPDYEWTAEWNDYMADSTNETKEKAVTDKLRALAKYMLAMAEYQLS
ncbi:MAG: DUF1800 domain-containing protein [Bacteriodetes bacterium]|nr:DUF1800 domain-containing protein [Bacteroidota bacterium]